MNRAGKSLNTFLDSLFLIQKVMGNYSRKVRDKVVRLRPVPASAARREYPFPRRRPRRRGLIFTIIFLFGSVLAFSGYIIFNRRNNSASSPSVSVISPSPEASPDGQTGAPEYLPPFTGETADGKPFAAAQWEDKSPLMLVFWAGWCDDCVQELRFLNTLLTQYGDASPLLVALHRDDTEPTPVKFPPLEGLSDRTIFLKDPQGTIFSLLSNGKPHMPLTLFVDARGAVVARVLGRQTGEQLRVNMARIVDTTALMQNPKTKNQNEN